jgi:hypothetical protein
MRSALNLLVTRRAARPNAISKPLTRLVTTKAMIFSFWETRSGIFQKPPRMSHYDPVRNTRAEQYSDSSGGKNAGTGSGQDGFGMGTVAWTTVTHLALTSSQPGHTGVSPYSPVRKRHDGPTKTVGHTPLVGALALHGVSGLSPGSHLGSTLGSGKSCPDPGRLSTFGVSGLCPCRRLTYRGACILQLAPPRAVRQTFTCYSFGVGGRHPSRPAIFAAYSRWYGYNVAGS